MCADHFAFCRHVKKHLEHDPTDSCEENHEHDADEFQGSDRQDRVARRGSNMRTQGTAHSLQEYAG